MSLRMSLIFIFDVSQKEESLLLSIGLRVCPRGVLSVRSRRMKLDVLVLMTFLNCVCGLLLLRLDITYNYDINIYKE